MVEPGRRCLGDRYELQQLIAAGGMGQVWRGYDELLGRSVAVKVLRSEYTGDPTFLARFRAEAQHAASLSHPNIAAVFDYGEVVAEDGSGETLAYLVMELVEGEPLSAVLRREAPLDIPATLSVLRQTAFALAEAHRVGMVHRDVKPGNILVRPDGSVKITDFGIAWSAGSVPLTRTGQVIGTAQYLSPEQAEGKHATPASDVYALGLVGYECLVGHAAFEGDNPVTIALKQVRQNPDPLPEDLPRGVRTLIGQALNKDPDARYPDGAAFVDAIEETIAGREPPTVAVDRPAAAVPPPGADHAPTQLTPAAHTIRPPVRRRRSMALVLAAVLVLVAGATIGFLFLQRASDDGGSAPAAATKKLESPGIVLTAADYVGRPVDDVVTELTRRGLEVQLKPVVDPAAQPGNVTDVSPVGQELSAGDPVVVSYARAPGEDTSTRVPQDETAVLGDQAPAPADGTTSDSVSSEAVDPTTPTTPATTTTTAPPSLEGDPTTPTDDPSPTASSSSSGSGSGTGSGSGSSTPPASSSTPSTSGPDGADD
ncbi:protein kinase domain-containing protein [Geodermatophilus sp. URMC 64]